LSELNLAFLGPVQITHRQWGKITLPNRKTLALFAYLAVESASAHSRASLLGLLWPELPTSDAQNNLRVTWSQLRQRLQEDPDASNPYLIGTRLDLQFNPHSDYTLDVALFRDLLEACHAHTHISRPDCAECAERLAQAVGLVRGEFLQGLSLEDCSAFNDWLFVQRERLHLQMTDALEDLAVFHERAGHAAEAEKSVRRLLELDPLREHAHRHLMRLLAEAGQRNAALAQYESCRRILADELGIAPAPETVQLAEQIRALAPTQKEMPRHNLPPSLSRFIGRKQESRNLQELLTNNAGGLVTLTGPGGVGKTRLAIQVAYDLLNRFSEGGVWLVELAGVSEASAVPAAIASVLKVTPDARRSLTRTIGDHLRDKSLLLVLDNCEHLLEACAQLVKALRLAAPGLVLLATSRTPLHLEEERVVRLQPFPSPEFDPSETLTAALALQFDSIQLFAQRAVQSRLSFMLTDSNAGAVAQICKHLDGIPLAIEIAAARAGSMAVEAIAQRLHQRFVWLNARAAGALPRQQTLRALIDWSYDLLNERERSLFRRLAVFAGGWTLEAAEAVCEEADACAEILSGLVDQSLVIFGYDAEGKRYRLHETIRQYAREQLHVSGEEMLVLEKHSHYYAQVVAAAVENQAKRSLLERLQQLHSEHDNLGSAFEWALEQDKDLVLELVANLGTELRFWELRGFFEEGRRWLQRALETTSDSVSLPRAKALLAAAELSSAITDFEYGLACAVESQRIFTELGDRRGEVEARLVYVQLADFHWMTADLTPLAEEAFRMAEEIQYTTGLAKGGWVLGKMAFNNAEYKQAIQHMLPSVALWRGLDRPYELAAALNTFGASLLGNQQYAAASEVLEEVADIYRSLGYRRGVALALHNLGDIAVKLKDYQRARELLCESLSIRRELGLRRGYAYSFEVFAVLAYEEKQDERAVQLFAATQTLRDLIGAPLDSLGDRELYESILARLRAKLGDAPYEMAWSKGSAMNDEQAIELALS
jgi:predicted ATPase/DNA-binding SARP family transcriptional activator